jgi:heme-degrading monooxygenase HmoA
MFAVIFAVQPKQGCWDDYLNLARLLRPELENIEGFIDNERFRSTHTEGRVLSLSIWRDEKALIRWRTLAAHHTAQEKGRFEVFADYHLRVGEITVDSQLPEGQRLQEQRFDVTEVGLAQVVTLSEFLPSAGQELASSHLATALGVPRTDTHGVIAQEVFTSLYHPGKLLLLVAWQDAAATSGWQPGLAGHGAWRHRHVRVIRDYGMFDRREAPQYYPDVKASPQTLQRGEAGQADFRNVQ